MLDVYVSEGCENCRYARMLAHMAAEAFPAVRVRILELNEEADTPANVFATPTYLLNGRVVSLGNPGQAELYALLEKASALIS